MVGGRGEKETERFKNIGSCDCGAWQFPSLLDRVASRNFHQGSPCCSLECKGSIEAEIYSALRTSVFSFKAFNKLDEANSLCEG